MKAFFTETDVKFYTETDVNRSKRKKQFGRGDGKTSSRRGGPEIKALGPRKGRVQASGSTHLKSKATVNEERRKGKNELKLIKREVPTVKSCSKVASVTATEY